MHHSELSNAGPSLLRSRHRADMPSRRLTFFVARRACRRMTALNQGDSLARYNAFVLAAATALAGANASVVIATGGLIGRTLSGDVGLATIPVLFFVVGTAATTFPASFLMRAIGRRGGFIVGSLMGVAGGLVGSLAILKGSFGLYCVSTALCGSYQAFVMQYRFAAADTASPAFRPKAISWVLAGGVAAAFVGPQMVIATKDHWAPHLFAMTYLWQAGFALLAAGALTALRAPPPAVGPRVEGRKLREIFSDRRLVSAVALATLAQGVMNFVMTSTPLAMVGCGLPVSSAALSIQWHILGMFAPSFVTGHLIARFGKERVALAGFALLASCGLVALSGLSVWHFHIALILLGVGWNFAFVSATTMLSDGHRPEERAKVQATNDFIVFGGTALAAWSAGLVLERYGWGGVVASVFPTALFAYAIIGLRRMPKSKSV